MNLKKCLATVLCGTLLLSALFLPSAAKEETVQIVVELEGDALLDHAAARQIGLSAFLETKEGRRAQETMLFAQEQIQQQIPSQTEPLFTYTAVTNGFAIETTEDALNAIKAIDGVKNAFVSRPHPEYIDDPADETVLFDTLSALSEEEGNVTDSCCDMMNADKMHAAGYTGRGRAIGIIDTELDVNHELFRTAPPDPRYTLEGITAIASDKGLSSGATANTVYRNLKIPYAYNYTTKSSAVEAAKGTTIHGSHVAGIAAGSNGTLPDGKKYDSVACDAQLFFFAVPDLSDAALLAAYDDAAKFDLDVVNCSYGAVYQETSATTDRALKKMSQNGTLLSISAGNSARGYYNNVLDSRYPDYGSCGEASTSAYATSVASTDNLSQWTKAYQMTVNGTDTVYFTNGNDACKFSDAFCDSAAEYVYCGTASALNTDQVSGKIAVVAIDGITKTSVFFPTLIQAGASGALVVMTSDSLASSVSSFDGFPTAMCGVSAKSLFENGGVLQTSTELRHDCLKVADAPAISSYSSWGVESSLDLKPEIAAPGGGIYSSVPTNEYALKSGTSMAAPHMTGATAVLSQFIDETYKTDSGYPNGYSRNQLNEFLMMSSAVPVRNADGTYASPRLQGAGAVDLWAAAHTPVILINQDTGKTKINLYDKLSDTLTVTFDAVNLTDAPAGYDLSVAVETDDATEENGLWYPSGMKALSHTETLSPVTVPAQTAVPISLEIRLSAEELAENLTRFPNGFYLDGFVFLTPREEGMPQISIPFMGFYGDWEASPAFDEPYFSENSALGETFVGSSVGKCTKKAVNNIPLDLCDKLGVNRYTTEDTYDKAEYAGVSPDGDGRYDILCVNYTPLRTVIALQSTLTDSSGQVVDMQTFNQKLEKFFPSCEDYNTLSSYPEGDYVSTLQGKLNYPGAKTQSVTMPFYIDVTDPTVGEVAFETHGDETCLVLKGLSDNRYLQGLTLTQNKTEQKVCLRAEQQIAEERIPISNTALDTVKISLEDYAGNLVQIPVPALTTAVSDCSQDKKTVTVSVGNTAATSADGVLSVAAYDQTGRMIDIVCNNAFTAGARQVTNAELSLHRDDYDHLRVFFWKDLSSMLPLSHTTQR